MKRITLESELVPFYNTQYKERNEHIITSGLWLTRCIMVSTIHELCMVSIVTSSSFLSAVKSSATNLIIILLKEKAGKVGKQSRETGIEI